MFNDKMTKKFGIEKPAFPKLKGHIKLTLHNVHNGKNEIYEGDNIITNAVQDIFANNYLGCVDYNALWSSTGIWKTWFGGVLCYENAHPTVEGQLDPADYFPKNDAHNHLTAHAGQVAIDPNYDDDDTRGNPIPSRYVETEDSHKVVFEWGTASGNGVISALSLTHSDTGNAGLGNAGYYFQNLFNPLAVIDNASLTDITTTPTSVYNIATMYDENHGLSYHIGTDEEYGTGSWDSYMFRTTTLTIKIKRLPYLKTGLFETLTPRATNQRTIVVEDLPFPLFCQPAFYFDYENKYLWIFSNLLGFAGDDAKWSDWSTTQMNYAIIDCKENPTSLIVSSGTFTVTPTSGYGLAPSSFVKGRPRFDNFWGDDFHAIIVADDKVYLPTTSGFTDYTSWNTPATWNFNGYKVVKVSTGVELDLIELNTSKVRCRSPFIGGELLIGNGFVCNDDTGYSCVSMFSEETSDYISWNPQRLNQLSFALFPYNICYTGSTFPRYIVANKMVNTTKFNLPSAIQKTASQAMSVEYTLQELNPEE